MKNLKKALFSLLAGAVMCGCSSDKLGNEPTPNLPDEKGEGFYMSLDIQLPNGITGSRSQTDDNGGSTGGIEIGSDAENTVSSALIVLADKKDYGFIAAGEVQSNNIKNLSSGDNKEYQATATIQKTTLEDYYSKLTTTDVNPEVYVFVFCNPTRDLTDAFKAANLGDKEWINKTCSVIQGGTAPEQNLGIWSTNSFLMNNVEIVSRMLPKSLVEWQNYNTIEKPFHLSDANTEISVDNSDNNTVINGGAIKVQRSVARFDFKDGSPTETAANTYNVLYYTNNETGNIDESKPLVEVQLQRMALVNMSNSFYYLPRVSNNGQLNGEGYQLCGKEKPWGRNPQTGEYSGGNYVVGPYATVFNTQVTTGFSTYFNYPFFNNDGTLANATMATDQWNVYKVEDVLKGRGDNYNGAENTEGGTYTPGTYKVWRYVTENVIPADPINQRNGISTGVVFKGKLQGTAGAVSGDIEWQPWDKEYVKNVALCLNNKPFVSDGKNYDGITGNSAQDPILYYFNGHLYMTWPHIRQAAIQAAVTIGTGNVMEINRSNSLYKAVFGNGPIPAGNVYITNTDGKEVEVKDPLWTADNADWKESADYAWTQWSKDKPAEGDLINAMRKAVTGAGITIYQSSTDVNYGPGYYCYYYYWNRHNDNGMPGVMGPMEFDVVRNNVYKLSVNKISRLGHPRIPDNDPDHPDPDDPDESDKVYMDVRVNVVPWAVRINSIEF